MLKSAQRSPATYDFDPLGVLAGAGGGAVLWARQGAVCVEQADLFGALQCFQRSLEVDIDCVDAWTGLSGVFVRMHDGRRADACLEVGRRIRGREVREATA